VPEAFSKADDYAIASFLEPELASLTDDGIARGRLRAVRAGRFDRIHLSPLALPAFCCGLR
jgi:hypothetical protein